MKKGRTFLVVALGIALVGCGGSAPKQPEKPAYSPTFDYTPPSTAAPNSAQVTVAVVSPQFPDGEWFRHYPFSQLRDNMGKDLVELLNARGYTVKGPFKSRDEMTYSDKEGSDLILVPDMDMTVRNAVTPKGRGLLNIWHLVGTIETQGQLNLSLIEPLSAEKMWTKNVALPPKSVSVVSDKSWFKANDVPSQYENYVYDDKKIRNALGPSLEDSYKEIMEATWKHLDPKELASVKEETKKLRDKIRFQAR